MTIKHLGFFKTGLQQTTEQKSTCDNGTAYEFDSKRAKKNVRRKYHKQNKTTNSAGECQTTCNMTNAELFSYNFKSRGCKCLDTTNLKRKTPNEEYISGTVFCSGELIS